MSVSPASLHILATIAAFARGVDDPDTALAALSAAQMRAFKAEYGLDQTAYTATEIASAVVPDGVTLDDACHEMSMMLYNCGDGTGHDHLTDADAEHFATLARALLAEAALTGNRGDYGERLRARLDAGREVAPVAPVAAPSTRGGYIQRDEAIARIRAGLKLRSGKAWSVTGGTGTARGWIYVNVPPKLRVEHGGMNEAARAELGTLFGLDDRVHFQGLSIAPEERVWHVARAEGNAS